MKLKFKVTIALIFSSICSIIFLNVNCVQALTQEEAGQYIAEFSINFCDKYADQTIYSWTDSHRFRAYNDVKTTGNVGSGGALNGTHFENKYAMDCVGWVSFAIHHALGINSSILGSSDGYKFSYFVVPTNCTGTDLSIMEKVNGELKPGDILVNSHHVMVYVGNDMIVDSAGAGPPQGAISKRSLAQYGQGYSVAYRIRADVAAGIDKENATTIFNGSGGITNTWTDSTSTTTSTEAYQNGRIVDVNDKLPLFKHILLTEKYNFNMIKWKTYGHGYDGKDSEMQSDLNLGLKYPKDESNTKLDDFIDFSLPYLQTWMIPLGMNAGVDTKGAADDTSSNPLFTYSVIRKAMSDIIVNRYDITTCVLTTKYRSYDIIKVTENYSASFDENNKLTGLSLVSTDEQTVQSGINEPEENVSKKVDIEPEYYIKQALTFDNKINNEFEYIKYSDSDVDNRVEDGTGYVGKEIKDGEIINEVGSRSTSNNGTNVTITYEKKVGNYKYVYRTWRDEVNVKDTKSEPYTYEDVKNYNKRSSADLANTSNTSIATDENGTDQTVNYKGKTITYSAAFASQTKTPEELGLKYEKITNGETTNYDACRVCNENVDQIGNTGIKLTLGRKIVARWTKDSFVDYGDWVYIEGWGYALVADCGGFTGKSSDKYHLDCFVGQEGDVIDDGQGNYSALSRRCINWKGVYEREPGSKKGVTMYRIKAEDIPEELLNGETSNDSSSTSSTSTISTSKSDNVNNFLFIGDSLTAGLKESNCLSEASVMGVVSSSAYSWNKYLEGGNPGLDFSHINLPDTANGISVTLGINSLNIESGGSTNGVVDSTLTQTKTLLSKLESKYQNIPIYVQRVFPIGNKASGYDMTKTNQVVNEYNEKIKSYCAEKGYTYIDATAGLLDSEGNLDSSVTSDGVHFTSNGYSIWESNIKSAIANGGTTNSNSNNSADSTEFSSIDDSYYKYLEKDKEINKVDLMNSKPSEFFEYLKKGTEYSSHIGYSRSYLTFSYSMLKRLFEEYFGDKKEVPFAYGSSLGYSTYTGTNSIKSGSYNFYNIGDGFLNADSSLGSLEKDANKKNILIIAGHSYYDREKPGENGLSYTEPAQNRKIAMALAGALEDAGLNPVILNRVMAHNKGKGDYKNQYDVIWGDEDPYSDLDDKQAEELFSGYDYIIELHHNSSGNAHGSLLTYPSEFSKTEMDEKLLQCFVNNNMENKKLGDIVQGLRNYRVGRNLEIPFTYIECEFYDNNEAMAYIEPRYNKIAGEMAMVFREYFGVTTPIKSSSSDISGGASDSSGDGSGVSITGTSKTEKSKMVSYLKNQNPSLSDSYINELIDAYISEGEAEGIRGDIAFAQACVETDRFKFDMGTAVTIDQNNFCGMGVTTKGMKGNSFPSVQIGVRAQIQHLKAYCSTEALNSSCVDPRFDLVSRGKATDVKGLGGNWAADVGYGKQIMSVLQAIQAS